MTSKAFDLLFFVHRSITTMAISSKMIIGAKKVIKSMSFPPYFGINFISDRLLFRKKYKLQESPSN